MDTLIQFLRDLLASGQAGFVIIVLLIFIGGAIFVIWSQRQSLARIELNMKSADTARQQLQNTIEKQYDFVVRTNDELRKELERYKSDQTKFESDVRKALVVGFDEIKASLANVTVSEIINQIPEKFKKDLEIETTQATEHAIQSLIERLKESETIEKELFNNKELERVFREVTEHVISDTVDELSRDYPNSRLRYRLQEMLTHVIYNSLREMFDPRYYDFPERYPDRPYDRPHILFVPMNDRAIDLLAEKIARRLPFPRR
jgi:hypothetical protein